MELENRSTISAQVNQCEGQEESPAVVVNETYVPADTENQTPVVDEQQQPAVAEPKALSALELFYQVKRDELTKDPIYLKAMQLIEQDEEDDVDPVRDRICGRDPLASLTSFEFLKCRLTFSEEDLQEKQAELQEKRAEPFRSRMDQILSFDLSNLEQKVQMVNSSVENLNRNIRMMRQNITKKRDVIPVDEEKLEHANFLMDNLLKISKNK